MVERAFIAVSVRVQMASWFSGRSSLEWRRNGIAEEPVEVFEEPHEKKGYREHHDVTRKEVRERLLHEVREGDLGVAWLASPCTSYCDWQLQNGGSRTFDNPEGTGNGPLAATEATGNELSNFAADYFETLLDAGGFPLVESSAPSGRYTQSSGIYPNGRRFWRVRMSTRLNSLCALFVWGRLIRRTIST